MLPKFFDHRLADERYFIPKMNNRLDAGRVTHTCQRRPGIKPSEEVVWEKRFYRPANSPPPWFGHRQSRKKNFHPLHRPQTRGSGVFAFCAGAEAKPGTVK